MKRVVRGIISLFGAGIGVGLLYLVFTLLAVLDITDVAAGVSATTLALMYVGSGVLCALIFFLVAPKMERSVFALIKKIETKLTQIPMQDVLSGIAGLMIGLILALLLSTFISKIPITWISVPLSLIVYIVMGYLGVTVAIKRKGEIGFVRRPTEEDPFPEGEEGRVEEPTLLPLRKRQEKGADRTLRNIPPKILDTSVIIDGRIYDIAHTGVLEGRLIIPSFVLQELRHIADSADGMRRARGRRGLDMIHAMQTELKRVQVVEKDYPGLEVDEMLISLAREMKGKIVTNDFNLNKVATVKGVEVLNINQLANALKPAVLPGEEMEAQIMRVGKEPGQGVAYLDDGTMIVVDGGKDHVGETLMVVVTSVLQTAAGRMVFAKVKD